MVRCSGVIHSSPTQAAHTQHPMAAARSFLTCPLPSCLAFPARSGGADRGPTAGRAPVASPGVAQHVCGHGDLRGAHFLSSAGFHGGGETGLICRSRFEWGQVWSKSMFDWVKATAGLVRAGV